MANRGNGSKFLALATATLLLAGCSTGSASEVEESGETSAYPDGPIELVVPFNAGGPTDIIGRIVAENVSDHLPNDAEMVVVNRPGAGGTIGTAEVINADPDGYTLTQVTGTSFGVQPNLPNAPYSTDDLTPIAQVAALPSVLVVNSNSELETLDDFVSYASENPGSFQYGTPGAGSFGNIMFEALTGEMGVDVTHIPFEGNAPAVNALLGNNIDGAILQTIDALPHIESGDLKALALIGSYKPEAFADVPLASEEGYKIDTDLYFGIMAPNGVPEEVRETLTTAIEETLSSPEVISQFEDLKVEPKFAGPDEFSQKIDAMQGIVESAREAAGGSFQ